MIKKRITRGNEVLFFRYDEVSGRAALACTGGRRAGAALELLNQFPLQPVRDPMLIIPPRLKRKDRLVEHRLEEDGGGPVVAYLHKYGNGKWFAYFSCPAYKMVPWLKEMGEIGYHLEDVQTFGRAFT